MSIVRCGHVQGPTRRPGRSLSLVSRGLVAGADGYNGGVLSKLCRLGIVDHPQAFSAGQKSSTLTRDGWSCCWGKTYARWYPTVRNHEQRAPASHGLRQPGTGADPASADRCDRPTPRCMPPTIASWICCLGGHVSRAAPYSPGCAGHAIIRPSSRSVLASVVGAPQQAFTAAQRHRSAAHPCPGYERTRELARLDVIVQRMDDNAGDSSLLVLAQATHGRVRSDIRRPLRNRRTLDDHRTDARCRCAAGPQAGA